jgi:REP element-mobilizing transposase RayT
MAALAYHITWTTYGTWLPGDARGWIKKNTLGIQEPDSEREEQARELMAEEAVLLAPAQRALVEHTIREHCQIRKWSLHAVNARSNHVHMVVTADCEAREVMNQLKAWCSRKLSDAAGLENAVAVKAGRRRWFTEGGNHKTIEDEEYLNNAVRYVMEGQ